MGYKKEQLNGGYIKLSLGGFDIYDSPDDVIKLKDIFSNLFVEGDTLFFFLMREEDLTAENELIRLRKSVINHFESHGQYYLVDQLDSRRFASIAAIKFDSSIPDLIIDSWKLFYACDFFVPRFPFSLDDYLTYLFEHGKRGIDGIKHLRNELTDMFCIKGYDSESLYLCYNEDSEDVADRIARVLNMAI
ncbi:hypothetical protein [Mucilaginibacter kameinonensis]|uniref:hypothetical protein n=1 Tax=Mucilaginibacter kameinonensis TaxID=452286 RepID=UPI000EF8271A|nr:hypothetical protein [Mucilaginibacter kameinonensis]